VSALRQQLIVVGAFDHMQLGPRRRVGELLMEVALDRVVGRREAGGQDQRGGGDVRQPAVEGPELLNRGPPLALAGRP
jgi:hypothetical protein